MVVTQKSIRRFEDFAVHLISTFMCNQARLSRLLIQIEVFLSKIYSSVLLSYNGTNVIIKLLAPNYFSWKVETRTIRLTIDSHTTYFVSSTL